MSCPGSDPVTVNNGAPGAGGPTGATGATGSSGQSCSVTQLDGGVLVSCPGSNPVTVPNGQSCSVTQVDGGVTVACPGSNPVTITNGASPIVPAPVEQCLVCHGPGSMAPVEAAHKSPFAPTSPAMALPGTGLQLEIYGVTNTTPVTVSFRVKDYRGAPVDLAGIYSTNIPFTPSFSLAYVPLDGTTGATLAYKVYTRSGYKAAATTSDPAPDPSLVLPNPTAFTPTWPIPTGGVDPTDAAMKGLLVENGTGAGDYTYTYPTGGTTQVRATSGSNNGKYVTTVVPSPALDSTKLNLTHTIWVQARRQWDLIDPTNPRTFQAVNQEHNWVPDSSTAAVKRQLVTTANCSKCHNSFKPESTTSSQFHSGGRVESPLCNHCHNPDRLLADGGMNTAADSARFVHRLHGSLSLVANPDGGAISPNAFHGIQFAFPHDIRSCDTCHAGALQGNQAYTRPTRTACGSCHDQVDFVATTLPMCTNPSARDAEGRFVPCRHVGGPQATDANCTSCHGNSASLSPVKERHLPVLPPDPKAAQLGGLPDGGYGLPDGGTSSSNVNAAWIAAAGAVPPGALLVTYDLKSAGLSADGGRHPEATFKLKISDGGTPTDVDFGTASSTNKELIPGFVGSPSVYFVFSVPQDGIAAPADFNASASCYVRSAWNGTATGTSASACTLSAKDGQGYYTASLPNVVVPANAKMLTTALGYGYNIASSRPLTQVDLAAYPYNPATGIGGLIVAPPDATKVATGFTARRPVVDTARCNSCHVRLGVGPTFHAGQRNDAPSCSFCHTPNRTSSGWAANAKDIIHSIHAGRFRTTEFNWHATSPGENFSEVEFPSNINNCQACHAPGTYDFSASSTTAALPNMLASTAATGKYNKNPATNPTGWFSISPYVIADNVYDYGGGFSFNTVTGATTLPGPKTLVKTPITAACSGCHDGADAVAHMQSMGGLFYQTYRPRQP